MKRRRDRGRVAVAVLAATLATALFLPAAGPAEPLRDALVRPGKGIGKIQLGMTLTQVRRALGPSTYVSHRIDYGTRGRYLQLGWELPGRVSWEPNVWRVGLRSTSPKGALRVVRVSTTAPAQRTTSGLGVGSRTPEIARKLPRVDCVLRLEEPRGVWMFATHDNGAMTAFSVLYRGGVHPDELRVGEVLVQRAWLSRGQTLDCPFRWRR